VNGPKKIKKGKCAECPHERIERQTGGIDSGESIQAACKRQKAMREVIVPKPTRGARERWQS
jgi:hypothetical protein